MKNTILLSITFLLFKVNLSAQILPKAWVKSGTSAGSFTMEIKPNEGINNSNALVIESIGKEIYGSGAAIQTINVSNYLGKRVKLSAYIKTENVKDFASLIICQQNQLDDIWNNNANNNDDKRTNLKGNFDYKIIESYLNVNYISGNLVIGAMIKGEGKIWIDHFNLEVLENIPEPPLALSKVLQNTDFEDSLIIAPEDKIGYKIENDFIVFTFILSQFGETTDGMSGWRQKISEHKIKQVFVAGDFNNWEPKNKQFLMKEIDKTYELKMPLSAFGNKKISEFKFVINGKKWVEPKPEMMNKTQSGQWIGNYNLMILR